jgi:poly(A) polymerase
MRLRADVGEVDEVLADWWQEFNVADDATREDLLHQVRLESQKKQRVPRVHSVRRADKAQGEPGFTDDSSLSVSEDGLSNGPPKKRRRRRRKPSGGADGVTPID